MKQTVHVHIPFAWCDAYEATAVFCTAKEGSSRRQNYSCAAQPIKFRAVFTEACNDSTKPAELRTTFPMSFGQTTRLSVAPVQKTPKKRTASSITPQHTLPPKYSRSFVRTAVGQTRCRFKRHASCSVQRIFPKLNKNTTRPHASSTQTITRPSLWPRHFLYNSLGVLVRFLTAGSLPGRRCLRSRIPAPVKPP